MLRFHRQPAPVPAAELPVFTDPFEGVRLDQTELLTAVGLRPITGDLANAIWDTAQGLRPGIARTQVVTMLDEWSRDPETSRYATYVSSYIQSLVPTRVVEEGRAAAEKSKVQLGRCTVFKVITDGDAVQAQEYGVNAIMRHVERLYEAAATEAQTTRIVANFTGWLKAA